MIPNKVAMLLLLHVLLLPVEPQCQDLESFRVNGSENLEAPLNDYINGKQPIYSEENYSVFRIEGAGKKPMMVRVDKSIHKLYNELETLYGALKNYEEERLRAKFSGKPSDLAQTIEGVNFTIKMIEAQLDVLPQRIYESLNNFQMLSDADGDKRHVLKYYGCAEDDNNVIYIVTEAYEYPCSRIEFLQQFRKFSLKDRLAVYSQMANGLSFVQNLPLRQSDGFEKMPKADQGVNEDVGYLWCNIDLENMFLVDSNTKRVSLGFPRTLTKTSNYCKTDTNRFTAPEVIQGQAMLKKMQTFVPTEDSKVNLNISISVMNPDQVNKKIKNAIPRLHSKADVFSIGKMIVEREHDVISSSSSLALPDSVCGAEDLLACIEVLSIKLDAVVAKLSDDYKDQKQLNDTVISFLNILKKMTSVAVNSRATAIEASGALSRIVDNCSF